jgi:hypothetical protein
MNWALIELEVTVLHTNDLAWYVDVDGKKRVWLPKAQCELNPRKGEDGTDTITIPRRLAEERGLA